MCVLVEPDTSPKFVHDITHVKLQVEGGKCLDQDKKAKLLFKVPVYFESSTRISKMFLVVFVLGAGNIIFSLKFVKWHLMEIYDIEN